MKKREPIERFLDFCMPEPNTGCWIWCGARGRADYGWFWIGRNEHKYMAAHRASYTMFKGNIPESLQVCHTCDNHFCVNPDHLFTGTSLDNMRDKMAKGRHKAWKSKDCNLTKLTESEVLEIRRLSATGLNNHQIAKLFNTCRPNVSIIVNRKSWKKL